MTEAMHKVHAAFSLFDCKLGKNKIFATTTREICIRDFPEHHYLDSGTKVQIIDVVWSFPAYLVIRTPDGEETILGSGLNPMTVEDTLKDVCIVLPITLDKRVDETGYTRQRPAPNPINTSSPPLETDARRNHCHKHKKILYPEEICMECSNERRAKNG